MATRMTFHFNKRSTLSNNKRWLFTLLYLLGMLSEYSSLGICNEPTEAKTLEVTYAKIAQIPAVILAPKPDCKITSQYLQDYYASIQDWGVIVQKEVRPVPNKPLFQYIGLPKNIENDLRPTAYAAMVLSFLSEVQPPEQLLSEEERNSMRANAIGLLRYLSQSHVAVGGTCLNGKPWGKQWQSAPWARSVCFAGWQVWPHLDKELQNNILKILSFEADRFIEQKPKSSLRNDTGAEENAWNASICSMACNMLPQHPHAQAWETAAKKYMYNTFSIKADAKDQTLGDDGKKIQDWVTTVNAHNDFTVENHGIVHVGYLKNSACMIQENAIHWLITDEKPPKACSHHLDEVFEVLCACMNWNGSAIYFAGNDWRLYETQCSDVILYCMQSLLSQDSKAAYLERTALNQMRKIQISEGGYYNGRRDLEYGGLCATRLITCFYAHTSLSSPENASTKAEFDEAMCGVKFLKSAKTMLHRTSSKFASFSWAQKRMGLAVPSDSLVVWPHSSSYLGIINREGSSNRFAKLTSIHAKHDSDGFEVTGSLLRCKGKLAQDFYFASPAGDYTIYVERLRPMKGFKFTGRQTGVIGLDYPIGKNFITVSSDAGKMQVQGKGGVKTTHQLQSSWLNINDSIGYVVLRPKVKGNVIRINDKTSYHPRRPHLQEWISLIGNSELKNPAKPEWACVITFVNLSAEETKAKQAETHFEVEENSATVKVGNTVYKVKFDQ